MVSTAHINKLFVFLLLIFLLASQLKTQDGKKSSFAFPIFHLSIHPSSILSFFIQCSIHPHIYLSTLSMYPSILYFLGGTGDPVLSLRELTLKWRKQLVGDDWLCAMLRDVQGIMGICPT